MEKCLEDDLDKGTNSKFKAQLFYELMDPSQLFEVQKIMVQNIYDIGGAPTSQLLGQLPINIFVNSSLVGGLIHSVLQYSYQSAEQLLCLLFAGSVNKDPTEFYENELRKSNAINNFADSIVKKEIPKEALSLVGDISKTSFSEYIFLSIFGYGFDKGVINESVSKFPASAKEDLIRDITEIAVRYRDFNFSSTINAFKHGARTKLATISIKKEAMQDYNENDLFVCRLVKKNSPGVANELGVLGNHFDIEFEKAVTEFCCSLSSTIVGLRKQILSNAPKFSFNVRLGKTSRFIASDKAIFVKIPTLERAKN